MSRSNYIVLGLVALLAVVSLVVWNDPERAAKLNEMSRNVALTGDTRNLALMGLVVVIGGFIAYLTMTRR